VGDVTKGCRLGFEFAAAPPQGGFPLVGVDEEDVVGEGGEVGEEFDDDDD